MSSCGGSLYHVRGSSSYMKAYMIYGFYLCVLFAWRTGILNPDILPNRFTQIPSKQALPSV